MQLFSIATEKEMEVAKEHERGLRERRRGNGVKNN